MKKFMLVVVIILFYILSLPGAPLIALYGDVDEASYLSGKFNPSTHSQFVNLDDLNIETDGRKHYLRRSTAVALKKMVVAFKKDNPNIRLYVTSSTRNFNYQKAIWDAKFNGSRKVDGKALNKTEPNHLKRALTILQYSSMPGTSRHHWGTDLDFNSLVNSYYENGEGLIIYNWLKKNAPDFGFYQPYTAGRKQGYNEEKWHWSYLPESSIYLRRWMKIFGNDTSFFSKEGSFGGSEYADRLAPIYVMGINPECVR
ncbi:MAG: M15 family metallopeptidase [Spirochaetes bacterium]|nr:M15 family metallopeptidase [Spirochaetota bacterium]MBN2769309.1 M15 family metallopeptidase [Spirochaetota bacterium]